MEASIIDLLEHHGVRPSIQRVAIAEYVLRTGDHPSADEAWSKVKERFPMVSRATVYNTLQLFVEKGLLHQHVLAEGCIVYDPNTEPHHHFVDDDSGAIHDIPWSSIKVGRVDDLEGIEVRAYQVVVRGTRKGTRRKG